MYLLGYMIHRRMGICFIRLFLDFNILTVSIKRARMPMN